MLESLPMIAGVVENGRSAVVVRGMLRFSVRVVLTMARRVQSMMMYVVEARRTRSIRVACHATSYMMYGPISLQAVVLYTS